GAHALGGGAAARGAPAPPFRLAAGPAARSSPLRFPAPPPAAPAGPSAAPGAASPAAFESDSGSGTLPPPQPATKRHAPATPRVDAQALHDFIDSPYFPVRRMSAVACE